MIYDNTRLCWEIKNMSRVRSINKLTYDSIMIQAEDLRRGAFDY